MKKSKFKFILDGCLPPKNAFQKTIKRANLKNLQDIGLRHYAIDEEIIKAAQREKAFVLSTDIGTGFNKRTVFNPSYKDAGVILLPERYDENEMDDTTYNLITHIDSSELRGTRTIASRDKAIISTSRYKHVITFK